MRTVLLVLFALTAATLAAPPTPDKGDDDRGALIGSSVNATSAKGRANSRQLTNSIVPNAGTGVTAGSTTANVANSLDVLKQHLAATAGNNPLSVASELQAQAQEAMQLQKVQNQQNLLANVQAQKQQVATAQAALTTPASTVGKPFSPANPAFASVMNNPATQQTYAQLEAQRQKLALQQQLIQQAIRPDAYQQSSAQQIMLNHLLNGASSQATPEGQQIAQQIPVQSNVLQMSQYPGSMLGTRMFGGGIGGAGLGSATIYDSLYYPTVGSMASMNPALLGSAFLGSQITQEILLQQQQQQQLMLLQQQQLAMMNPYLFG